MAGGQSPAEQYRAHPVWESLRLKREMVEKLPLQQPEAIQARDHVATTLRHAEQAKGNTGRASIYLDLLDQLNNAVSQNIPAEDRSFRQGFYLNGTYSQWASFIRMLPAPMPRGITEAQVQILDEATALRKEEVTDLRTEVQKLGAAVEQKRKELAQLDAKIEQSKQENADARARIAQTAEDAQATLDSDWQTRLAKWELTREKRDEDLDRQVDEKLGLLTYAAQAAERLVEHAASRYTARDWTERAARERRDGRLLRRGAVSVFVLAGVLGSVLVVEAINRDHGLDLGSGLLRIAVVTAVAGLGYFLSRESRHHFNEADSAEEVAVALRALEPYYASAESGQRASARDSVGEMLFVRNIQSRFAARDASKHNGMDNQQLNDLIDTLTKSADLGKKASGS